MHALAAGLRRSARAAPRTARPADAELVAQIIRDRAGAAAPGRRAGRARRRRRPAVIQVHIVTSALGKRRILPGRELSASVPGGGEALGRRVVRGREPAVAEARDAPKPGRRAPAREPERDAPAPARRRRERGVRAEEVAKARSRPRRTASSAPRRARRSRRSRAPRSPGPTPGDDAPVRQQVERRERLGQRHRAAKRDERHRRRQLHGAGALDHGGQRGRTVEPGRLKQEVVVGRDRGEAALPRGVNGARETSRATAPRPRTP